LVASVNNINIGLMNFNTTQGGNITYAMEDIATAKDAFTTELMTYTPSTWTPLSETLYEAARYYRGEGVVYGTSSVSTARQASDSSKYKSPIEHQCQENVIVLLTDGQPTEDTHANSKIPDLPGFSSATGSSSCANDHGSTNGKCLDELAQYLFEADQSSDLINDQSVSTYTIGFDLEDTDILSDMARLGNGQYYPADNATSLTSAFTSIINDVLSSATTLTAPAVSVNAFNRTTHRNELYYSVFQPSEEPHWNGNLKKYKIDFSSGDPVILDADGKYAIDASSGFFRESSKSYWTPADIPSDGEDVASGGAASQLDENRKVYTYSGTDAPSNASLATDANTVTGTNTAITDAMLGPNFDGTDPTRSELLEWARGMDVKDEFDGTARPIMGDPLHSRPAVVQYGGTENDPKLVIFFGTNDGYLHAIDEKTGKEIFSFIPQELLPNLVTLYESNAATPRPYGLDGSPTVWVKDDNEDGIISDADHVYLYIGMRRGGKHYYALDVTDTSAPVLMWMIDGEDSNGKFAELGQTWSEPVVSKVKHEDLEKTVLIFGGGYDEDQDSNNTRQHDTEGRALYIVDAKTGKRLWWAGPADSSADLKLEHMTNSIPANVNVLDVDSDHLADIVYVGDTYGQLWRFDINNEAETFKVTGGRIAELSGDAAQDNRRFYHAVDVAYSVRPGKSPYLSLVIGSGYRAHPLDEAIEDRIYMLRDGYVFSAPDTYTTVEESGLHDATLNILGQGDTEEKRNEARVELAERSGWYIKLNETSGEKVLARALIIRGTAIVTTYAPDNSISSTNTCGPNAGTGTVYYLNLADATPTHDLDESDEDYTRADRKIVLKRSGIPPSPTFLITEGGNTGLIATEAFGDLDTERWFKTYWFRR
jgi:type IV pilus assembly protein PilY1